jgi:hypothetical protein
MGEVSTIGLDPKRTYGGCSCRRRNRLRYLHPIGEACARFVQQVLNIARGHADLAGEGLRRECRVGKALARWLILN